MARRIEPVCRQCRREGIKLYLKGIRCTGDKCAIERRNFPPGQHKRSQAKLSDYGTQLREKQKMKKIYGLLERQFRFTFAKALRKTGVTGENLISLLERRLDNVAYRLLFATSRAQGRQMVKHGFLLVNGRKVDVPSFVVRPGDKITVKNKEAIKAKINANLETLKDRNVPEWLSLNKDALEVTVVRAPAKSDANLPVEESLIVELFSK